MNCSEVLDLLSPLYDGELSPELSESVEQHLRECPACASVRADFGAMSSLTRQQPDLGPPTGLWQNIEEALDADSETVPAAAAPSQALANSGLALRSLSCSLWLQA